MLTITTPFPSPHLPFARWPAEGLSPLFLSPSWIEFRASDPQSVSVVTTNGASLRPSTATTKKAVNQDWRAFYGCHLIEARSKDIGVDLDDFRIDAPILEPNKDCASYMRAAEIAVTENEPQTALAFLDLAIQTGWGDRFWLQQHPLFRDLQHTEAWPQLIAKIEARTTQARTFVTQGNWLERLSARQ